VEKKLFMKRGQKGLHVASHERRLKQQHPGLSSRAEVRRLADLTSGLVLTLIVGVGCALGDKNNKHQRQTDGQHPGQRFASVASIYHVPFQLMPNLS